MQLITFLLARTQIIFNKEALRLSFRKNLAWIIVLYNYTHNYYYLFIILVIITTCRRVFRVLIAYFMGTWKIECMLGYHSAQTGVTLPYSADKLYFVVRTTSNGYFKGRISAIRMCLFISYLISSSTWLCILCNMLYSSHTMHNKFIC